MPSISPFVPSKPRRRTGVAKVELSVDEVAVLHEALEEFIESGSSGLEDCECRRVYDRLHKILTWGTGFHLLANRKSVPNSG
jgi:hypothetical protein